MDALRWVRGLVAFNPVSIVILLSSLGRRITLEDFLLNPSAWVLLALRTTD
jgi:hypothetical protein